MLSSQFVGEITEQQIIMSFLKIGILVSKPIVVSSKYDLVADINDKLYKIQIKTGTFKENTYLEFATSTSHTNSKGTKNTSYKKNEVDFFATVYENQAYLVPFDKCGKRSQRLRFVPVKNKQKDGILFAKDYLLENIVASL